jgi:membrane-associated phospholipid phosphatase
VGATIGSFAGFCKARRHRCDLRAGWLFAVDGRAAAWNLRRMIAKRTSNSGKKGRQPASSAVLAPFSSGIATVIFGIALVLALFVFHAFPAIDRAVSGLFFANAACAGGEPAGAVCGNFPARHVAALGALRQFLQHLPAAVAAGLGAAYAVRLAMGTPARDASMTPVATALIAYLLSVGLLVNGLLKAFSGRPRPLQSDLFGGTLPFVPAGEFTDYCASNCSFVSGEAAAAAWLIAAVSLLPSRYGALRLPAFAAATAYAIATSMLRISFGAHYLSDTVVAALATLLIFAVLAGFESRRLRAQDTATTAERSA